MVGTWEMIIRHELSLKGRPLVVTDVTEPT